jgi:hypothetical protein
MTAKHKKTSARIPVVVLIVACFISACGGSDIVMDNIGDNGTQPSSGDETVTTENEPPEANEPVEQTPSIWTINSIEGLEFSLIGAKVVNLAVGEDYVDAGAVAMDDDEGDVSSSIAFMGSVDTGAKGDYLLRYRIEDISGGALEVIRLVRIFDDAPVRQTHRIKNSTVANLDYLEHLPPNYGASDNLKAPLIIFNHGSGASGTGDLNHVECCGIAGVLNAGSWDDALPFVVLSPQREIGIDTPTLNVFVDYAIATYEINPNQVYMAGWSQGANATMLYSIAHPEKLAAIVPTAGGLFRGVPSDVCNASSVPMWLYLGEQDSSFINNTGLESAEAYSNCSPSEPVKVTRFLDADHYTTSIWPFLPEESHATRSDYDHIDQSIFDWFLSHSL